MTSSDVELSTRLDFPSPPRSHQDATKSWWKERNAPPSMLENLAASQSGEREGEVGEWVALRDCRASE